MNKLSKMASSSATSGTTPTDPVFEFDHEKGELKISIPYVPEYLTVELWAAVGGVPTIPPLPTPQPPAPGPGDAEGVPVKPPKRIEVLIQES